MHNVRLDQELSVDIHVAIDDFQVIARQADHAFDEMLVIIVRILEHNNVAALQRAIGQKFFVPGIAAPAENEFVDEQMIPNEKSLLHRLRRDLECLKNETRDKQRQNHSDQERFEIFGKSC